MANEFQYLPLDSATGMPALIAQISHQLNGAYSHLVSGPAIALMFTARVAQTAGNLTVYFAVSGKLGSPTNCRVGLYNSVDTGDDDRPDATELAFVVSDKSAAPSLSWLQFDLTGVTLTQGRTYFLILSNESGTPASNCFNVCRQMANSGRLGYDAIMAITSNGITTDPSMASGPAPYVLVYNDGTKEGMVYAYSVAAASNSNTRGNRYVFPFGIKIKGVNVAHGLSNATAIKVYIGTTEQVSVPVDYYHNSNSGIYLNFPSDVTIPANTPFFLVATFSGSSTALNSARLFTGQPSIMDDMISPVIKYVNASTIAGLEASAVDGLCAMQIVLSEITPGSSGGGETSHAYQL